MKKLKLMTQPIQNLIIAWLMTLLLITTVSGCAFKVKLVGEYDEVIDKSVTELQQDTVTFFAKLKSSKSPDNSWEANKEFYNDTKGKLSVLILRSEVIEKGLKRNPITRNFKDLQAQYNDFEQRHKKGLSKKYIESAEKAFLQSFRAIMENILYLKWNQSQP